MRDEDVADVEDNLFDEDEDLGLDLDLDVDLNLEDTEEVVDLEQENSENDNSDNDNDRIATQNDCHGQINADTDPGYHDGDLIIDDADDVDDANSINQDEDDLDEVEAIATDKDKEIGNTLLRKGKEEGGNEQAKAKLENHQSFYHPAVTTPYMTKYEVARILGERAEQIAFGAPILINTDEHDALKIARLELAAGKINMILRRPLGHNLAEDCLISVLKTDNANIVD